MYKHVTWRHRGKHQKIKLKNSKWLPLGSRKWDGRSLIESLETSSFGPAFP